MTLRFSGEDDVNGARLAKGETPLCTDATGQYVDGWVVQNMQSLREYAGSLVNQTIEPQVGKSRFESLQTAFVKAWFAWIFSAHYQVAGHEKIERDTPDATRIDHWLDQLIVIYAQEQSDEKLSMPLANATTVVMKDASEWSFPLDADFSRFNDHEKSEYGISLPHPEQRLYELQQLALLLLIDETRAMEAVRQHFDVIGIREHRFNRSTPTHGDRIQLLQDILTVIKQKASNILERWMQQLQYKNKCLLDYPYEMGQFDQLCPPNIYEFAPLFDESSQLWTALEARIQSLPERQYVIPASDGVDWHAMAD